MRKVMCLILVLAVCLVFGACTEQGGIGQPEKISDIIPYHDGEAEVYSRIDTLEGRWVKLAYSEEQTEELAELLDSIDLRALAAAENLDAAGNSAAQYLTLLILCGEEEYKLDICGTEPIYLNLYENEDLIYSWTGDQSSLLVNELGGVDYKVREYSHDVTDFMVLAEGDIEGQSVNRAVSLYLDDVMKHSLKGAEAYDGTETDFNVSMRLKDAAYYLNTDTRTAAVMSSGSLKAAVMEEEPFLCVMRKISGKLMLEERIAAEVKAAWDAWMLETELEKETPYPILQKYRDMALGQWFTEEFALRTAEQAWLMMEACRWYAEENGYLLDEAELERHLADTAKAFSQMDTYVAACSELGISVEDWVRADWRNQEYSLLTTEIYTGEKLSAEELTPFMNRIAEEYLATDAYAAAEPAVKRSLELLASGQELKAEQLRSEDIFIG